MVRGRLQSDEAPPDGFISGGASFDDETAKEKIGPLHHPDLLLPERMTCLDQKGEVVCTAKDGGTKKFFPSLEGPAAMCSPVPDKGQQRVYEKDFSTRSEATVQMVILTSNPNRK